MRISIVYSCVEGKRVQNLLNCEDDGGDDDGLDFDEICRVYFELSKLESNMMYIGELYTDFNEIENLNGIILFTTFFPHCVFRFHLTLYDGQVYKQYLCKNGVMVKEFEVDSALFLQLGHPSLSITSPYSPGILRIKNEITINLTCNKYTKQDQYEKYSSRRSGLWHVFAAMMNEEYDPPLGQEIVEDLDEVEMVLGSGEVVLDVMTMSFKIGEKEYSARDVKNMYLSKEIDKIE